MPPSQTYETPQLPLIVRPRFRQHAHPGQPCPPHTRWKYFNLAFAVAGLVVEKITGQRWADYVQARIIAPLGMAAAAGMTSSVEDLAKFISAQFRGGPAGGANVLSAGSWREALPVRSVNETWENGGFDHVRVKGRMFMGHEGGYFSNTTMTRVQFDGKVGVVVLTNTNDSHPTDIANQLLATVGDAVAKAAKPKLTPLWDDGWARFAGCYRLSHDDSVTQVILLNKQLVLLPDNGLAVKTKVVLEPLEYGRFRLMAPTGDSEIGEIVRFDEKDGK